MRTFPFDRPNRPDVSADGSRAGNTPESPRGDDSGSIWVIESS